VAAGLLHHTAEAVAGDDEASYYIHRSSIAPEPTPLLKPAVKVAASALFLWLVPVAVLLHFCRRLPFLARPRTILHQDRLRYRWRLVYSDSYVAKVAVTKLHWLKQVPMTEVSHWRDNSRPSDHCGRFCRLPSRIQPPFTLIVDGNSGSAGNHFLYVSAMLLLRLCRCAADKSGLRARGVRLKVSCC